MSLKKFTFDKKIAAFKQMFPRLPAEIGVRAKRHFDRSFRDRGFTDDVFSAWQKRKTRNRSDRRNPTRNRAILVDSGNLKNSIRVKSASWPKIVVGSYGVPYASPHNRGERPQPKRQFIGYSKKLAAENSKLINDKVAQIMKTV